MMKTFNQHRPTVYLHLNGVGQLFQGDTVALEREYPNKKFFVGEPAFELILDNHTRFDYQFQTTRMVLIEKLNPKLQ